jgi:predicted dienelactone hydrolase
MTLPASHETPDYGDHRGDPAFQERQFVDPGPYVPPWMVKDAFTKHARTYADQTIEEVEDPDYIAAVSVGGLTPHESEFSWGLGNQNSLTKGPGPTPLEILKAQQRTNPADPGDTHEAHYRDAGWVEEP